MAANKDPWPKVDDGAPTHLLLDPPTLSEELKADWDSVLGKDPPPEMKGGLPLMSDDEVKEFVLAYCDGRVFTSEMIQLPRDSLSILMCIFMPLIVMGDRFDQEFRDNIGLIWEYMDQAGSRSINGYPTFFSCRFMHKDDWFRASAAIKRELDRRNSIEL